jgi:hypothetical protein
MIIEWRRPMIMEVTPAYCRPTAEQAAARHQQIRKHWRRQRERRSEERPSKPEDVRLAHLRWRELQRLSRYRYGAVMPDTFEARRDLEILLGYAILTGKKPSHQAELWAPWLDPAEAEHLAAHQRPILHRADDLAKKLDLHYCDRQALAITTIGSVDVDQAERDRLRRQRDYNERKRKRKAKQEEPMQTETAPKHDLSRRQLAVLEKVDGAEIATPELVEQLRRHRAFRGVAASSLKIVAHRVLDQLKALGLITDRFAPGQKGRPVRHVSRCQQ